MAMRFLRVIIVCAVITSICPAKSGAQVANLTSGVSGVLEIPHSLHVKDPEDVIVPRGQQATLRCGVRALFSPQAVPIITWLHGNEPIPKNDTRRVLQKDGSLYFPRVTGGRRPLTGAYRCRVKNEIGTLISGEAKLKIASLEMDTTEETIEVPENQPVVLPCQAQSVPEAKVRWDRNRQTLPHNIRYVPLPSGALLILKSLPTDEGLYRCIVTNSILKKSKTKTVTLTVLPPLVHNTPVSFLPLPFSTNATVTLGMKTSLYCAASGLPLPQIDWLKDGQVVSNTSVFNISLANQASAGLYMCRARNSVDSASQNYLLTVQQKPYFRTTPKSKKYTSAGTVKLECNAVGYPEPCVHWLKNGQRLKLGGRIKKKDGFLVMSHTFTYDAGIYQCIASNSAGSIWTSAQVVLTSPNAPPAPEDVRCRPYDDKGVCITWRSPQNVNASAFSIYSFSKSNDGCSKEECQGTNNLNGCDDGSQEESGPDYVTISGNYHLANRLNASTNYTFYVRLYSTAASDDSNKASCLTGVKGDRNLKFELLGSNTIQLKWSEISSDIPCGSSNTSYIVQWRKENQQLVNNSITEAFKYNITDLNPSVVYHFRVMSATYVDDNTKWVALTLPQNVDNASSTTFVNITNDGITQNAPTNPEGFKVTRVSAKSVTLSWTVSNEHLPKSYVICYVKIDENEDVQHQKCEDGKMTKSQSNMKQIDDLKPNTLYEFRIRAHNSEGFHGPFSSPIEVRTHPDVPSTVLDLKYRIINESMACLAWLPPLFTSGKLTNYIVTYTPDPNWPLEEWTCLTLPIDQRSNQSCWSDNEDKTVSVPLTNLRPSEDYTVIVRAASTVGLSNPTRPFVLKTGNKKRVPNERSEAQERASRQRMGLVAGCVLALICIVCSISCIILRRRCVKQRNLTHARLTASNNYYPGVAHYATQGSSVQVRLENTCEADLHEIQNLVASDGTEIPTPPAHLDSKGRDPLPNGHINGLKKPSVNGHLLNGHVHITENPQFERKDRNGDVHHNGKKTSTFSLFHDDPNSNRIQSPRHKHHFLDLSPKKRHKCSPPYDINGLFNGSADEDSFTVSSKDLELNATQMTCLDDTFIVGNHRRISPLLGPNG